MAFDPGLEDVIAAESAIAEPDKAGSALRYRGVDIEELVGEVPYEQVWGLLVDGRLRPGLPIAESPSLAVHTGDARVDLQAGLATLAAAWSLHQLFDGSEQQARDDLARCSAAALSFLAQSARGAEAAAVPRRLVEAGTTASERFLLEWQGEPDPRRAAAVDAYLTCTAEHGMNASTFTARVMASTGADPAACLSGAVGAISGPLHGGAPARVLRMLDEVVREGDASRYVRGLLDRRQRLMGFGHRVYRAEDPRARLLRRTAKRLGAPRVEVAEALEAAALAQLKDRYPDRVLATNVEFWSAVVLDFAQLPPRMFTALFACARTAGWSAHILEQKQVGRLIRPSARYVGPPARSRASLEQ